MIGLIDVGGGFRDIYGTGVLDTCLDYNIEFDCCVCVSAGSANVASFLSKQKGRNFRFYTDYAFRKDYFSASNIIHGKRPLNLDYVYNILSNEDGEDPVDFETFSSYKGIFNVVATNGTTGRPHYFSMEDVAKDDFKILSASSSIPVVAGATEIDGVEYFDGGASDPIPIKRALELGCDKLVIILTKPIDTVVEPERDLTLSAMIDGKYPQVARALRVHSLRYNRGVKLAKKLEAEGKAIIIAPEDTCGVSTLSRDKEKLTELYNLGLKDGLKVVEFMKQNG